MRRLTRFSSLSNQTKELKESANGQIIKVYSDIGSGLNENRAGLKRMIRDAEKGMFNVVRVTHSDRLTRFGYSYLEHLLQSTGCEIEILHKNKQQDPEQELVDDFVSLIASFSGRLCGQRSKKARERLLEQINQ